jgi:nucleotide-binding universal stress UspA family protein
MPHDFFVPILTYPDPTPMSGIPRALDVAATIGGRLSVSIAEIDIPPIHSLLAETLIDIRGMAAEAEQSSRTAADRLETELRQTARRFMLSITTRRERCTHAALEDLMVGEARQHDISLLVLEPMGEGHIPLGESIVFRSGGPVLLCPAVEAPGHLYSAMVAWDGSSAAARAIRDALPILSLAKTVSVVTLTDDKPIDPASMRGVIDLLAFHGIKAESIEGSRGTAPVGEALQDAALNMEAGLLVMGAFGHSRFREFILGGATASALRGARLPILMSH